MDDPHSWLGVAILLALGIFGAASWLFHKRLHNQQSLRFLWSMAALALWFPLSSVVTSLALMYSNSEVPGQLANWLVILSEILVPALLMLFVATNFWLAVRTIAPQPNQKMHPTR